MLTAKDIAQLDTAQLDAIASMVKGVPEALRDCVASKIIGVLDGVALAVAIEAQKLSA